MLCETRWKFHLANSGYLLPYMANVSMGEFLCFFAVFEPIVKVFPLNHLLCAVYDMIALV